MRYIALFLVLVSTWVFAEERDLLILHTNDFHGHIKEEHKYAGAARIAAYFDKQRGMYDGVLIMDAGDAISGTPVSTMFEGEPIFHVMNAMNYDIGLLGNHEFDHGYKKIERFREIAEHPLLGANSFDPNGEVIADQAYEIREINGIKVGVIGVVSDYTPRMITPKGNENLAFPKPAKILGKLVPELKPQVDLLVVLSHIGHKEDKALANAVPGIDLIVGGHSHTYVNPAVNDNGTWIVQANEYGTHVGRIKLTVDTDTNRITEFKGELIAARELPLPSLPVLALVNSYEEKVEALVDVEIATAAQDYDKATLQTLFEQIMMREVGAELGYYNMGGIRDVISEGPVTARHLWNIEPFGNTVVQLTITGADFLVLISQSHQLHGSASRIDPEATYIVATNSFIGSHAEKAFGDDVALVDTGRLVRDVLIEHIRANGFQGTPERHY